MRSGAILLVLLVVAVMPGAGAAPTTLHAHVNGFQDFVLHPVAPDDAYAADSQRGLAEHALDCLPDTPGQTFTSREAQTWYGYVGPGAVDYDEEGPRIRPERGIAYDLDLDTDAPAAFHWYLSTHQTADAPTPSAPVPIVVDVTVREGDDISVANVAYDTGRLVAAGSSGPVWTAPTTAAATGRDVYHFEVPLTFHADTIPASESFNVRVDARLDESVCQEGKLSPQFAVHTSPDHRPRLEWSVAKTLHLQAIGTEDTPTGPALHARIQSAFGSLDVASAQARLVGPDGDVPVRLTQRQSGYHGHAMPPEGDTFTWHATTHVAGPLTWHVNATNAAGTEHLAATVAAERLHDAESPALVLPLVAALLLGLARRAAARAA